MVRTYNLNIDRFGMVVTTISIGYMIAKDVGGSHERGTSETLTKGFNTSKGLWVEISGASKEAHGSAWTLSSLEEEEEEGGSFSLEGVPLMVGPIEPGHLEESIIVFSEVYAMAQLVPLKMNYPKMDR
ncbi:unnamed protein product, partial [Dovyalis caffra]